jgi:GTPase SAR1 family protein
MKHIPTIGVELNEHYKELDGIWVGYFIWDVSSHPRCLINIRKTLENTIGVIIVYDITNRQSFECVIELVKNFFITEDKYKKCLIVGNKSDLED